VISELIVISLVFISLRVFLVRGVGSEESYHVNISKFLKDSRLSINGENKIFVPSGRYSNPILYHYLVSFLPASYITPKTLRVINCLYDFGTMMIFYLYLHATFGDFYIEAFGNSFTMGFFVAASLCLSPALIPLNSRTRGGGARTMGLFLCTIYFLALYEITKGYDPLLMIVCVISLLALLFSGQFGHQVAVFGTLVFSLISLEYLAALPLLVFICICSLFSKHTRTFFWCKFLAHYRYYKSVMKGTLVDDRKKNLLQLPFKKNYPYLDKSRIRIFIYLSPLYFLPFIYSVTIYSGISLFSEELASPFINFCQYISLSMVIIGFITFWYPFSVFGQSERYLEFATPFSLVSFLYMLNGSKTVELLVLFSLLISFFHLFLMNRKSKDLSSPDLKDSEKVFIEQLGNATILVSPYKRTFHCFETSSENIRYFIPLINTNSRSNWNENYNLFNQYSHYKSDWLKWNQEYGITHLLVQNDNHNKFSKDFNDLSLLKRFTNYYLYEIN
jgi:hypothetical protein